MSENVLPRTVTMRLSKLSDGMAGLVVLFAVSMLCCGATTAQNVRDSSFATVPDRLGFLEEPAAASSLGVPLCASLPQREERRSCLIEEDDAFVHIWGVDGGHDLKSTFSVHNSTIAKAAAARGKRVRLAINLELDVPDCPQCPSYLVAPMDVAPEVTAERAVASLMASLSNHAGAKLDPTLTTAALTTMLQEAHVVQYKAALVELMAHLDAHNTPVFEGSTSSFLDKVRFLQATVHRDWTSPRDGAGSQKLAPPKTVCEVGFNAGHSSLMWLMAGADRVVSFELGHHNYSHVAAQWLSARFPGRLHVVMGDASQTVPTFHAMFPEERCHIVLIDGGHELEPAWADVVNFKPLVHATPNRASSRGHVLVVDDTDMTHVKAAWARAQAQGLATEDGHVMGHHSENNDAPFSANLRWNGQLVTESVEDRTWHWDWAGFSMVRPQSRLAFGHYLP